jgi:hypothetical protein
MSSIDHLSGESVKRRLRRELAPKKLLKATARTSRLWATSVRLDEGGVAERSPDIVET